MAKFRKRPVVIDAVQWDGTYSALRELNELAGEQIACHGAHLKIKTLEGEMTANVGDWIIKGVKGEVYPCKPDVFALTYEPAETVTFCNWCPDPQQPSEIHHPNGQYHHTSG